MASELQLVAQCGEAAILSFDLTPVTQRLERKGCRNAALLEKEFRRFAIIRFAWPEHYLAPSLEVDEYWHEFVLDTIRYRRFCESTLGVFADHVPDDSGLGMDAQFSLTRDLYRMKFGEPEAGVWVVPGNSGSPVGPGGDRTNSPRSLKC